MTGRHPCFVIRIALASTELDHVALHRLMFETGPAFVAERYAPDTFGMYIDTVVPHVQFTFTATMNPMLRWTKRSAASAALRNRMGVVAEVLAFDLERGGTAFEVDEIRSGVELRTSATPEDGEGETVLYERRVGAEARLTR